MRHAKNNNNQKRGEMKKIPCESPDIRKQRLQRGHYKHVQRAKAKYDDSVLTDIDY